MWEKELTGGLTRRDSRWTVQIGHDLRDRNKKVTEKVAHAEND